jgi:hypothetical protein
VKDGRNGDGDFNPVSVNTIGSTCQQASENRAIGVDSDRHGRQFQELWEPGDTEFLPHRGIRCQSDFRRSVGLLPAGGKDAGAHVDRHVKPEHQGEAPGHIRSGRDTVSPVLSNGGLV